MDILIKHQQAKYGAAKRRKDKSRILSEFCDLTGYTRKHANSVLINKVVGWREKPLGRKKTYQPEDLLNPLKNIWFATNQICGKRLEVALPLWLPFYESAYGLLSADIKEKLLSISSSTIDRLLKEIKASYPKRRGGTKPGHLLRSQIPIKTNQWAEDRPGFVEGDTVAHSGNSLMGNFIWSITVTDIYSGWTENAAIWNKGAHGAKEQIESIEKRLPFPLLGWDSDGGGEFLNHHLLKYFQNRDQPVQFTRSRAYHSGDNAHVEQKNSTHVRQLFGYNRFDNPAAVSLMNDVYSNELSLLRNFFLPAMKLQDKIRIQAKVKKCFDKPKTPYQRLMESEHLDVAYKERLKEKFESLNPFQLKINIEKKMKKIFSCFSPRRYIANTLMEKSKKSSSF